jgi:hypothetical protein
MSSTLPLKTMSVEEKLQAMEALWNDLCINAGDMPSPAWHENVLAGRQAAVERGEDTFEDWDTAKEKIKKTVA